MPDIKLTFSLDEKTANRVERYWHSRRFPNRSEAIKKLVKYALNELEDHDTKKAPTQKQIEFVRKICKNKNIDPPDEFTINAYSKFIGNYMSEKITK